MVRHFVTKFIILILAISQGAVIGVASASPEQLVLSNSADSDMLLAAQKKSNKKGKKRKKSNSKNKPAETPAEDVSSEAAPSTEEGSGGSGKSGNYVSGEVPSFLVFDRYPVSVLKNEKPGLRFSGAFTSESNKTSTESNANAASGSNTVFLVNADYRLALGTFSVVPTFWFASAGNKFEYTTVNATGDEEVVTSNNDTTVITPGAGVAMALTPMIDAALNFEYLIGSSKGEASSSSYSVMLFTLGAGFHSPAYEAGLSFQPGTKYKVKSKSDAGESEDEQEQPNHLSLMGRFKIGGTMFVGGQYESESQKDIEESTIDAEFGLLQSNMQFGGAVGLINKKIFESSESGFRILGHVLMGARSKQSFGATLAFKSTSGGDDTSKRTETGFGATVSANLAF